MSNDDGERPTAFNSADPVRNFTLNVDERIRALTIGVPAWAARKRWIEDEEARLVKELVELHDRLLKKARAEARASDPDAVIVAVRAAAAALDLGKLNKRVAEHNRYYPVEANLPMNRHGRYLVYGKVWEPEEPYTGGRLFALAMDRLSKRG